MQGYLVSEQRTVRFGTAAELVRHGSELSELAEPVRGHVHAWIDGWGPGGVIAGVYPSELWIACSEPLGTLHLSVSLGILALETVDWEPMMDSRRNRRRKRQRAKGRLAAQRGLEQRIEALALHCVGAAYRDPAPAAAVAELAATMDRSRDPSVRQVGVRMRALYAESEARLAEVRRHG